MHNIQPVQDEYTPLSFLTLCDVARYSSTLNLGIGKPTVSSFEPRLITPPREEEEIYPYRRAWRSIVIETGILFVILLVTFVLFDIFQITVPSAIQLGIGVFFALLPALLWVLFSRYPESAVLEPRRRLLTTFTVTALLANGVTIPLLDSIFNLDAWLVFETTTNRIIGYMSILGALQELTKYLVIRYTVWPQYYRVRSDAVAYGAASAVAFSSVVGLNYIINNPGVTPDAIMFRVFANTTVNILGSTMIAYGLSETLFNRAASFFLPVTFLLSALLSGIAISLRSSFMNAALGLTISAQRSILGILFSVGWYVGVLSVLYFLFTVATRREQEKLSGREV